MFGLGGSSRPSTQPQCYVLVPSLSWRHSVDRTPKLSYSLQCNPVELCGSTALRLNSAPTFVLDRRLQLNTLAGDNKKLYLEQKVVFLCILAYCEPQRDTAHRLQISRKTVPYGFHNVTDPFDFLHTHFAMQPSPRDLVLYTHTHKPITPGRPTPKGL
ncbi:Uncharacterized protein HZ326_24395 [Fusarium oxysporum f. sp. albedinis]|nr:Uncharacterized protein HZ326_24395 [Fusarium oxysporum f. sp. albedinis]